MWLLPSKDRPANLARFFAACRATGVSTPGLVLIDSTDFAAHRDEYVALELPPVWHIQVTDGVAQGDKIREVWKSVKGCEWVGRIGDDNVPETIAWDRRLIDALDGWNIISCNDGWQAPKRIADCWVMSGALLREVGYIFAPGMQHLFVDDLWETVGRDASCWQCLMDVKVDHRHVLRGLAKPDKTFHEVYGEPVSDSGKPGWTIPPGISCGWRGGVWTADETAYRAWCDGGERKRIVDAIIAHRRPKMAARIDPDAIDRGKRAASRKVFIGVPTARSPAFEFTISFADTLVHLTRLGMAYETYFLIGSSNLPQARNRIAAKFLASTCTDLLFIDDDMAWHPDAVMRLLASEQKIIAGVGRKKVEKPNSDPAVWCFSALTDANKTIPPQDAMGAVQVRAVGTGFIKIERSVFETMIAAHPEWKRPGSDEMPEAVKAKYYQFFRFDPDDQGEMGEDYVFCKRYADLGGTIWIDPEMILSHVGSKAYTGSISEIMQRAASDAPSEKAA